MTTRRFPPAGAGHAAQAPADAVQLPLFGEAPGEIRSDAAGTAGALGRADPGRPARAAGAPGGAGAASTAGASDTDGSAGNAGSGHHASGAQADVVLARLARWRQAGWLRALDLALPRFLHTLDPQAPPGLLQAAALLTHLEGRGHGTLPLGALAHDGPGLLGWPAEAQAALAAALAELPADADAARAAWAGCRLLAIDPLLAPAPLPSPPDQTGRAGAADTPLVLDGDRLYLRRYWRHEAQIAARVRARAAAEAGPPLADPPQANAFTAQARALMARLFPPRTDGSTDWQAVACALALRGRLTVVTGGPGTGKTYTAARLLVLLQALHAGPSPLRVALAAPTGKAAARLKQSLEQALLGLPEDLRALLPAAPPAGTLHQLLGVRPDTRRFRHDAAHPLALDLLFVDEASMVHLEMMDALLDALPAGTRLVLLGDRDQLASVEAGAVLADLCPATPDGYDAATRAWVQQLTGQALPPADTPSPPAQATTPPADGTPSAADAATPPPSEPLTAHTVLLRESRRFAGLIGEVARAVNRGDAAAARALLGGTDPGAPARLLQPADALAPARWAVQGRDGAVGLAEALAGLARRPAAPEDFAPWAIALLRAFERCRVLCALRDGPWGVAGLNAEITRALAAAGLLPRSGEWYEGRPVMVTRNAPALGVFNGDIGLVLAAPGATRGAPSPGLRAWFLQGDALHSVSVARLPPVQTAFALTVHKSQGSEFEHVLLVLPEQDNPVLTRELLYTGITRAKAALTVLAPEPARLDDACARLTRRLSGLKALLQQGVDGR